MTNGIAKEKKIPFSSSLPLELQHRIKMHCVKNNLKMNYWLETVLTKELDRVNAEEEGEMIGNSNK